jgi:CTP:molybdopterin cytidylyltransferase MocA/HD superfamily phosphohydrolase YqeK
MGRELVSAAVIAAAGKSSRMGAFKPLLPLGNRTILQRVIDTLKAGGVGEITVITGREANLIEDVLKGSGIHCIHNKNYETSDMFYSAVLGMNFLAKRSDALFFTPVDAPLFSAATVKSLLAGLKDSDAPILIPSFNNSPGHPVLFRSSAVEELARYSGKGGLRGAMAAYPGVKLTLPVDDPGIRFDVDTPEDYNLVKLMANSNMPEHIRKHCFLVARLAWGIGDRLVKQGLSLNLQDIETAALLHDMCRSEAHHAEAAAAVLRGQGLDRLADIVASHMQLPDQDKDQVNERVIVYLADKMAEGDRLVTVEERFEKRLNSVTSEAGKAAVMDNYRTALGVKQHIEDLLGQGICEILKF